LAIPDYETLMLPLLKHISDGDTYSISELHRALADEFRLSESERTQLRPSGKGPLFRSRVHWARAYLLKAGLLKSEARGTVRITSRGKQVLEESLPSLSTRLLTDRFPEMREWRGSSRAKRGDASVAAVPIPLDPEEELDTSYERIRASIEDELLRAVKAMSPAFFERLVVQLLLRLGYGGTPDSGETLGRSGDGGIDGVIKEDKLGLDLVYIQAKRWEGSVGAPVVRAFAGALAAHRAKKGVLITSSTFTRDAYSDAERMNERIVLVDGQQLAAMMYDVGLGVTTKAVYEVRKIDTDFFTDED